MEALRIRIRDLADGLRGAGIFLEYVALGSAALGTVGGLLIAFSSQTKFSGSSDTGFGTTTSHSYVGIGIVVVLASIVQGVFGWAIARALRLFADYATFRSEDSPESNRVGPAGGSGFGGVSAQPTFSSPPGREGTGNSRMRTEHEPAPDRMRALRRYPEWARTAIERSLSAGESVEAAAECALASAPDTPPRVVVLTNRSLLFFEPHLGEGEAPKLTLERAVPLESIGSDVVQSEDPTRPGGVEIGFVWDGNYELLSTQPPRGAGASPAPAVENAKQLAVALQRLVRTPARR